MTEVVRHRDGVQQVVVPVVRAHAQGALFQIVVFVQGHPVNEIGILFTFVVVIPTNLQTGIAGQVAAHRSLETPVLLDLFQRSHNTLRDPLGVLQAGRFRVHQHVKR